MDTISTDRLMRAVRARGFTPQLVASRVPGHEELLLLPPGADLLNPGAFFVLVFNPAVFAHGGPAASTVLASTPGREGGEYELGTLPSLSEALSFAAWRRAATRTHGCEGCGRLVMEEFACPNASRFRLEGGREGFCVDCCGCPEHEGEPYVHFGIPDDLDRRHQQDPNAD